MLHVNSCVPSPSSHPKGGPNIIVPVLEDLGRCGTGQFLLKPDIRISDSVRHFCEGTHTFLVPIILF